MVNSILCHIAADLICHRLEIFVSIFYLLSLPFSILLPGIAVLDELHQLAILDPCVPEMLKRNLSDLTEDA